MLKGTNESLDLHFWTCIPSAVSNLTSIQFGNQTQKGCHRDLDELLERKQNVTQSKTLASSRRTVAGTWQVQSSYSKRATVVGDIVVLLFRELQLARTVQQIMESLTGFASLVASSARRTCSRCSKLPGWSLLKRVWTRTLRVSSDISWNH